MFKLPHLGMAYYKYNYENTKEGEEVGDTEGTRPFCVHAIIQRQHIASGTKKIN